MGEAAGSSPRIRGKCLWTKRNRMMAGIIPANTGKIPCVPPPPNLAWDHPREYGENCFLEISSSIVSGSSPRIRGKSHTTSIINGTWGIIPANTGKIIPWVCRTTTGPDHPREYGENTYLSTVEDVFKGSSPRIRGKCGHRVQGGFHHGIIPANTGKIPTSP